MKLQKAVKQETVSVAVGTGIGCIGVMALFLILHLIFPESTVKFDYRVVLGALCGGAVAVANFFFKSSRSTAGFFCISGTSLPRDFETNSSIE